MNDEKIFVSIPMETYEELLKKATRYDIYREFLEDSGYITDTESVVFGVPKNEPATVSEPPEPIEEVTENA